ncbi:hypothetical protein MRB53_019038 [Persea americana]|uniref:Uncharacterized protein n=1 Tax=Persea americana TaxID=3435 RepID=A0ACC2MAI9_PERAE|nr:hypothetical protein MRB53_019038 [Persea americana]
MDFPSVPIYLDPPNWQQQQNHHHHGSISENPQLPPMVPQPTAPTGGAGSIRPGSMADRARLAKIPQPEVALKCPRCDSTNTKFCYFNNYSLSQPRHFCKTCRRYWTRGGALRNVPVGGGCRRKRSKGSSSKSPTDRPSAAGAIPSNSCTTDVVGLIPPQPPQLPFMASLHHHLSEYGAPDIGFNFGGISPTVGITSGGGSGPEMDLQMGGNSSAAGAMLSAQVHQFPFLTGLEPPPGLYPFEGEGVEPTYGGGAKAPSNSGNDQLWGGGGSGWTDLSGFSSSSTSLLL